MSAGLLHVLRSVPFILAHSGVLLSLAVLSYAVGRKVTARWQYHSAAECAAVCTSLGLGAIAFLVFGLAAAHWLYPVVLLGIAAIAAIACLPELRALAAEVRTFLVSQRLGPLLALGAGGLILVLPYVVLGLYPPGESSYDPLMYHLTVAKLYVQHHGLVFAPNVHSSLYPELNEMLFTFVLALYDDIAAQLVSVLMLALLMIALFAWGRELVSATVGYWASAILLGIPIIVWLGTTAYVDIGLTLFITLALYSGWNWLRGRETQWLLLAAAFAGLAAGTKYTGLLFFALLAFVVLVYSVRSRDYVAALRFVSIATAIAAPWYARNVYYTGNPVFPFLTTIFGHGYWSAEDVASQLDDIRTGGLQQAGIGVSLRAFVSLPWQLAFHPQLFHAAGAPGPKRFFLMWPLIVPFALVDRRIAFPSFVAFSYLAFWFFASQDLRYLVPVFPLISLVTAVVLHSILEWWPPVRRWVRHGVVVAIIAAACVYPGWRSAVETLRDYGPVPVTQEQRDTYLARYLPAYPAVQFLNQLKGPYYTVFDIGSPTMAYFADGTFIGENYGHARMARVLAGHGDTLGLYREAHALGADYLLLAKSRLPRQDEFFHDHFKLVYRHASIELYEIGRTGE